VEYDGVGRDGPNEVPEVELDWASLAVTCFEGLAVQHWKGRSLRGLPEGVYLRSQRFVGGKYRGVDDPLDVGERGSNRDTRWAKASTKSTNCSSGIARLT